MRAAATAVVAAVVVVAAAAAVVVVASIDTSDSFSQDACCFYAKSECELALPVFFFSFARAYAADEGFSQSPLGNPLAF